MEDLFIPYEEALALKELGFDEECFGWYNYGKLNIFGEDNLLDCYAGEESRPLAPFYQQAFKFFRDSCNLIGLITTPGERAYDWEIRKERHLGSRRSIPLIDRESGFENTYEEAELECLKRLIEIVKENGKVI